MTVKINNMPDYANESNYVVATLVDGELWFWGAYDDYDKAQEAVQETGDRLIVENSSDSDNTKHGHWFICEYEYLTCSVCGHSVYTGCECTSEAEQYITSDDVPRYCPHCGADMTVML